MPLLAAAVKSGSDGHDENKRDALNYCDVYGIFVFVGCILFWLSGWLGFFV